MSTWMDQLDALRRQLDSLDDVDVDEEEEEAGDRGSETILKDTLFQVCEVARNAASEDARDLRKIVDRAQEIINAGIGLAYGSEMSEGLFDFLPSFAHGSDAALVEDPMGKGFGHGVIDSFVKTFKSYFNPAAMTDISEKMGRTGPWDPTKLPHPKSSRLSRFRPNVTTSVTDATPLAQIVYQARCEITDDRIMQPSKVAISSGQTCLAVLGAGGWKNRDPMLQCHLLDDEDHMNNEVCFTPGLGEVAYTIALDEDRKLIFIGDSDRVKSYSWDAKFTGHRASLPAVHTLDAGRASGPLSVLPNGRVIRASRGAAFVWTIDDLPQHGPKGKRLGKGRYSTEDSLRDQDTVNEIETSTGTPAHSKLPFADNKCTPAIWRHHARTGHMITGTSGRRDDVYECLAIDLEHGGQCAQRYLGHGGDVEDISISEGDATVFATAASDGFARLFDVRQPLPVITFDHGSQSEYCPAVVLAHPDGVPTLFTGGEKSEQIKMWDVRARKAVYELATGNTGVASMAWDPKRSALYVATECIYMDRMGSHHDYRKARIPRWAHRESMPGTDAEEDGEDEGEYEEDEDFDDDDERYWPDRAYHGEDYFGYAFDAGDHRLYRYAFKEDPDPAFLPEYGEANMHDSYW